MIISSEKTGKTYSTVEECEAAEREFDLKMEERKHEEERKKVEQEEAYAMLQELYNEYTDCRKRYYDAAAKYNKKYGNDSSFISNFFRLF